MEKFAPIWLAHIFSNWVKIQPPTRDLDLSCHPAGWTEVGDPWRQRNRGIWRDASVDVQGQGEGGRNVFVVGEKFIFWLVVLDIFYFHPIWRAYFSKGWFNHQLVFLWKLTVASLPLENRPKQPIEPQKETIVIFQLSIFRGLRLKLLVSGRVRGNKKHSSWLPSFPPKKRGPNHPPLFPINKGRLFLGGNVAARVISMNFCGSLPTFLKWLPGKHSVPF